MNGHPHLLITAFDFECRNNVRPNFCLFVNNFNLNNEDVFNANKRELSRICRDNYDRIWWTLINESPKAVSYMMFKKTIFPEKYLFYVTNSKHRIALSRFRLSSHSLERGRHIRPRLERSERKCFFCKDEIEDEIHFLTKCPLYADERKALYESCRENSINFDVLETNIHMFVFILSNECPIITIKLARFIYNSFKARDKALTEI